MMGSKRNRVVLDGTPNLSGHVALVTGAAKGIGASVARRLAVCGCDVAIAFHVNAALGEIVAHDVERAGRRALPVVMDVRSEDSVDGAVAEVVERLGAPDILVNNAGVYPHSEVISMPIEEWDEVLAVNLRGPFLCSRAVARRLIQDGRGGRIINITSVDAIAPECGFAHYDAAKAGLAQLTRTMALEFGRRGITVNAIGPGLIAAPGIEQAVPERVDAHLRLAPIARLGSGDDVANLASFLASDAASFITGQNIYVDGGISLAGYTWAHEQYTGRTD